MTSTLFHGSVVNANKHYDTTTKTNGEDNNNDNPIYLLKNVYIGVDEYGRINYFSQSKRPSSDILKYEKEIMLDQYQIIMPGFVDTHVHAAQIQYSGTGTDLPLMKWLTKYAFPSEKRLTNNLALSRTIYTNLVNKLLNNGTTTCLYFGVLGVESSKILADVCNERKQRAFVGKVNMDRLSPDDYIETTEDSLLNTEKFIKYVKHNINSDLVNPVITPRFVPCCTKTLLSGLGKIAKKYDVHIQSHAVESLDCLQTVEMLHPSENEVDILNENGLLTEKSVMAHCVHINDDQAKIFLSTGTSISHCPLSNFYFAGGCLRTCSLLNKGVGVGLGTDIAGGYAAQMLNSIRHCVTTHLAIAAADVNAGNKKSDGIAPGCGEVVRRNDFTYKHAIWLATVGGAKALKINDTVGHFDIGMSFDALLINLKDFADVIPSMPTSDNSMHQEMDEDVLSTLFEKFIHLGDDRHFQKVWVAGNLVVNKVAATSPKEVEVVTTTISNKNDEVSSALSNKNVIIGISNNSNEKLSVIDLGTVENGTGPIGTASEIAIAKVLNNACRNDGFFYLKNHGVSSELIEKTFEMSKVFFTKLTLDEKKTVLVTNSRGYTPMAEETLDPKNQTRGDTKEGYYIGNVEKTDNSKDADWVNIWPDEDRLSVLKGWKNTMKEYFNQIHILGMRMLRILALSLDLDADFFDDKFTNPMEALRLLHYSEEKSSTEEGVLGCGAHSDYGMLTFLITDHVPGLEILRKGKLSNATTGITTEKEEWMPVPPVKDTFIVNLGDMLQRWTNDTYSSTVHRVVNRQGLERYSIPFFFEPNFDTVVEVLESYCSENNPAKYPPTTSGEHLLSKYAETHAMFEDD